MPEPNDHARDATPPERGAASAARVRTATRGSMVRGVIVSLAVHGTVAAAILGAAWGVSRRDAALPPVVLVADFENPAPGVATKPKAAASPQPPSKAREPDAKSDDSAAAALAARLRALESAAADHAELDALAGRFGDRFEALAAPAAGERAADEPPATTAVGASFAGLIAGSATKVAYVVDASGSMVGRFPAIVDEVERSLMRLEPTQRFTVICFRKDGAVAFEGDPSLRAASRDARAAAVRWLRERVVPAGRSSPLEALSMALGSGADCVFLLSTTRTGDGSHELDRDSMLALVDRLNPRDPASGRRRASIQCIQFLEPDPGATLEAIAAEHFGVGGFRFIPRSATTLDGARP